MAAGLFALLGVVALIGALLVTRGMGRRRR